MVDRQTAKADHQKKQRELDAEVEKLKFLVDTLWTTVDNQSSANETQKKIIEDLQAEIVQLKESNAK